MRPRHDVTRMTFRSNSGHVARTTFGSGSRSRSSHAATAAKSLYGHWSWTAWRSLSRAALWPFSLSALGTLSGAALGSTTRSSATLRPTTTLGTKAMGTTGGSCVHCHVSARSTGGSGVHGIHRHDVHVLVGSRNGHFQLGGTLAALATATQSAATTTSTTTLMSHW